MSANLVQFPKAKSSEMRPVADKGRKANESYRVREHLAEAEMTKLLAALKRNRHGHRDWLIGLLIYRHGLRVSEACDLRWDDIDLTKRTIIVRSCRGAKVMVARRLLSDLFVFLESLVVAKIGVYAD